MSLRALAEDVARSAGAVLREKFSQTRTIETKDGLVSNLVTDADRASEELILERLSREVPSHRVLAEETGEVGQGEFTWFVDPLDGTTNYAHGVPHFCVTLAVQDAQGMVVGITYDPLRDELFSAGRGEGTTLNGRVVRATTVTSLDQAVLATGFPYDLHQRPERVLRVFDAFVRRAQGMRRMGSAALDLAYVACGRFDGFFEFGLKPWDTAAGSILLSEAGALMKAIDGASYEPRVGNVISAGLGLLPVIVKEARTALSPHPDPLPARGEGDS